MHNVNYDLAQIADEIIKVARLSIFAVNCDTRTTSHLAAEMEQLDSEVAGPTNLVVTYSLLPFTFTAS